MQEELETHISSVIVSVKPEHSQEIEQLLHDFPGLDIAASDPVLGKYVAVLEQPSMRLLKNAIDQLESLPKVMAISMVYHHAQSEVSLNEAI